MYMKDLKTPNLKLVEQLAKLDKRELFKRLFRGLKLAEMLGSRKIVQIKYSCMLNIGAIRGLNYQSLPFSKI